MKSGPVSLAQASQYPLVMLPTEFCTRRIVDTRATGEDVNLSVKVEISSIEGIIKLVSSSKLISVLPSLALEGIHASDRLAYKELNAPSLRRDVFLLARTNAHLFPPAIKFSEAILETAKALDQDDEETLL